MKIGSKGKVGKSLIRYILYNNINHYTGIQKIKQGIQDYNNNMVLKERVKLITIIITIKEVYNRP